MGHGWTTSRNGHLSLKPGLIWNCSEGHDPFKYYLTLIGAGTPKTLCKNDNKFFKEPMTDLTEHRTKYPDERDCEVLRAKLVTSFSSSEDSDDEYYLNDFKEINNNEESFKGAYF